MIDLDLRKRTEIRAQASMNRGYQLLQYVEKIRDGKSHYKEVKVKENAKKRVKGEINRKLALRKP